MRIRVSVPGPYFLDSGGTNELYVEGKTALEVLNKAGLEHGKALGRLFSDAVSLNSQVKVLINDKAVTSRDTLTTPLSSGDVISVFPAYSGGKDMKRRIYLSIPKEIVGEPLLFQIGQQFEVVTNIRGASISDDFGLVALELTGDEGELDSAISWLAQKGVQVEQMGDSEGAN